MSFQPVIVGSGLVGWNFLKSTQDTQREVFESSAEITRDTDYFLANIGSVTSAEDLVSDRRLMTVALGAFGLQDDIDNKFFIQKVLQEGTSDSSALANKLAEESYKSLANAFEFDSILGPRTQYAGFGEEIVEKYRAQEFEIAVGDQDNSLRLALNLQRALPDLSEKSTSDDGKWFQVMGTTALRTVFETALGLPDSFSQLDIDHQLEIFREKSERRFGAGEIDELASGEYLEKVIQTYLLQEQVQSFEASGSGQVALTLLSQIPRTSILG